MKVIIFDVETTGLPKYRNISPKNYENWPHIVQFSWIICDNKNTEKSYIIKPTDYTIPEESTKIHNISHKYALENGVDIKNIILEFINDCKDSIMVAHNAEFDTNVILANCYRYGINTNLFNKNKLVCTMKRTTELCKLPGMYGYKYPKLEELHYFLFKEKPNLSMHNSLNDAKITLKCFKELCNKKLL